MAVRQAVLADKHTFTADSVVNIDETSCRLLLVDQVRQKLQGKTKEATTTTVVFCIDRGALDMLVQIVYACKTDAVLAEQPSPEHTHDVTSENGRATTTTLLQLTALDDVMNPGKEGQAWT